jgi:hypothetical protein
MEMEYNSKMIERLALLHQGNASAHLNRIPEGRERRDSHRSGWTQQSMLAASGLAIAASYWSLIDPRKAVDCYRRSALAYRTIGHGYWIVVALASGNQELIAEVLYMIDEERSPSPDRIAFAMVANEMSGGDGRGRRMDTLRAHWEHAGNAPIGRLGIPLDHYARCAEAMREARSDRSARSFFTEGANYIHRAAEVIRTASHDKFHWSNFQSTILPAEPEAVAMTSAMSRLSHDMFKTPITEISNLDSHGRLLAQVGEAMRTASFGPEHGRRR